ncbi:MAG: hypothetical protein JGK17_27005 [Microcoleus sp. PH2017_10_PVI_O_A]|uniref:hypothetical protein n=1 Tax=unclassified Microcoleus TaxID=2642155 RepID=UPI001D57CA84|nr:MULTISPECIES: hypothetical protein [unclassified Microcoleus]TAE77126.1 MAG: aminotransferase class III-fold pyridoxal phosphate-dependent enzyme [Oscillatoriales cyanobacterium]MCC3409153.1 hypothetical protein [Microcoleus sp. PH2017_10_PVI_O_A]MCC3463300.1 hypothetical protein [Microcoleus sp. PH2017_11_PCY_U_A]MCC3481710.1 hypothetical protein [Microcoleus sp. PH2017_12_PCY_D_A]MCC3562639.1 hypothetical protein [Microcoleus sp. PH2017_27_LUM_O_A]
MEPVTAIAIASPIVSVIANKALEKGGEKLGESAYKKINQMITVVRDKLSEIRREGILIDVEAKPTEENQSELKTTIEKQMTKDADFDKKLREFVEQLKSEGVIPRDSKNGDQYINTFNDKVDRSTFGPNSTITNN